MRERGEREEGGWREEEGWVGWGFFTAFSFIRLSLFCFQSSREDEGEMERGRERESWEGFNSS